MLVKQKKEFYLKLRGNRKNAEFCKSLGFDYVSDSKAFDAIQSVYFKEEFPYCIVIDKKSRLYISMNINDDIIELYTVDKPSHELITVLNRLHADGIVKYYNKLLVELPKTFLLQETGKDMCNWIFEPVQEYLAKSIQLQISDMSTSINSGPLIRIKSCKSSYNMNSVDSNPNSNIGLICNGNYLLNAIGKGDIVRKVKFANFEFHISAPKVIYGKLKKYNTLIPEMTDDYTQSCLECLGFICALYDTDFNITKRDGSMLAYLRRNTAKNYPNLFIDDVSWKYDKFTKKYYPYIFSPKDTVYYGEVVTEQTDIDTSLFALTTNTEIKYIKVGNRILNRIDVDIELEPYQSVDTPYEEALRSYTYNYYNKDNDQWQNAACVMASRNLGTVPTNYRCDFFKERYALICWILNGPIDIDTVNDICKKADSSDRPIDNFHLDALHFALDYLFKSELYGCEKLTHFPKSITTTLLNCGAKEALLQYSRDFLNTNSIRIRTDLYSVFGPEVATARYYANADHILILLIDMALTQYNRDYHCVRIKDE